MSIADGCVVLFHYTLTGGDGKKIDSSSGGDPLPYLHGAGNIVPGLERAMLGRRAGDRFDAIVAAKDGYGERKGEGPQPVPRRQFPSDAEVEVGMQFTAEGADGEEMPIWVTKVEKTKIWVDTEHPLAGVELHFVVEVVGVRKATPEELEHGHPHGAHGHDHEQ
jgi:FKBP-type peptidyl-prolyl cis-trans isomerase SlyD